MSIIRIALQGHAQLPVHDCHRRWFKHYADSSTEAHVGTSPPAVHYDAFTMRDDDEHQQKLW